MYIRRISDSVIQGNNECLHDVTSKTSDVMFNVSMPINTALVSSMPSY